MHAETPPGPPAGYTEPKEFRCSFCGKAQEQAERLIVGPNHVYICNECVTLCNEIIADTGTILTAEQPARGEGVSR